MQDNNIRTRNSARGIYVNITGYIATTISSFVCRMIFARCLTADYLGIGSLFTNILTVLSLTELGVGAAMVFELYKPVARDERDKIASLMLFYKKAYRTIGLIVAALGLALLPFLPYIVNDIPNIKENIYIIYALYLTNTVVTYFFSYRNSILNAYQRQYIVTGYSYVVGVVQNIAQIIILLITRNYMLYLILQIGCSIGYSVWVSKKASHDYPYIDDKNAQPLAKTETKKIFKNVRAITIEKLAGVLVNSTDDIAISLFSGLVTTGVASNYTLISRTLGRLITLIFNPLISSIGNLNAVSGKEETYRFFKAHHLASYWLYGWTAIITAIASKDIIVLCFGESYILGDIIPFLLAANLYIVGMLSVCLTFRSAMGIFRHGQFILLSTGVLNIVLDIVMGMWLGVSGIFLATVISRLVTNAWYIPYVIYKYGFEVSFLNYIKAYIKSTISVFAVFGISYFVCSFISTIPIFDTIIKIVICSIIFNGISILFYGRTVEFKYLKDKFFEVTPLKRKKNG